MVRWKWSFEHWFNLTNKFCSDLQLSNIVKTTDWIEGFWALNLVEMIRQNIRIQVRSYIRLFWKTGFWIEFRMLKYFRTLINKTIERYIFEIFELFVC